MEDTAGRPGHMADRGRKADHVPRSVLRKPAPGPGYEDGSWIVSVAIKEATLLSHEYRIRD